MLHFFRRIRQRLFTENRFTKYLFYAIGEILLVVIGILIALQVNNWNEERIGAENNKILFQKVSDELVKDIQSSDRTVNDFIGMDSIFYKILYKKATIKDYRASGELFDLPLVWFADLIDSDFNELVANKSNLTGLQDSIYSELIDLYGAYKKDAVNKDELIRMHYRDFRKILISQPWWTEYKINGKMSDEMIHYALTDPLYLNHLTELQGLISEYSGSILRYRMKATYLHEKIAEMLNKEKDTSLTKDFKDPELIKGTYKYEKLEFEIKGGKDLKLIALVDGAVLEYDVLPYSDSHVIFYDNILDIPALMSIEYGQNMEPIGFTQVGNLFYLVENGNRKMWKKIE